MRSFQLPLPHHWHHSSSPSTSLTSFKLPLVHHWYHEKASTFQLHAPPHNHWHHSRPPVFCGTVHDFGLPLLFVGKSVSIYSGKLLTSEECPLSEDLRLPSSCSLSLAARYSPRRNVRYRRICVYPHPASLSLAVQYSPRRNVRYWRICSCPLPAPGLLRYGTHLGGMSAIGGFAATMVLLLCL